MAFGDLQRLEPSSPADLAPPKLAQCIKGFYRRRQFAELKKPDPGVSPVRPWVVRYVCAKAGVVDEETLP